ncbi:histidinol-phosphate transaminase [Nocardioides limicola]|uniref:histidinol-phosphate transaminase n=1 Tax=Nocardioides limicola TaxID=2803368 RepID=UPI001EF14D61|nr:histidinol-phosphate transaminase [Nocardioides sp. DJM-14]
MERMADLPQPRPSVAGIPAYVAGRPPTPREGVTTFKLSSNELPYPPLPGVLEAATAAAAAMNRYPDMGNTELYAALADRLGVEVANLAAGTGSTAVIYQLLSAYCGPGAEVVHPWRSFEAYPIAIAAAGATAVGVPLTADGRHDLDAMLAAVTDRTAVLILCTPNNPTGPALSHTEVAAVLDRIPGRVLVILDEAYREFVRSDDPVDGVALLGKHPNLTLTRTFSKAYGLAGLRVGYAVAAEPIAAAVRAVGLPFGVSAPAQAAAVASLAAEVALAERVDRVVAERDRVVAGLAAAGYDVPDPQGNFVWLELGDTTAGFATAADEVGLMVRPFTAPGTNRGCRVTIGETDANTRFLDLARRLD